MFSWDPHEYYVPLHSTHMNIIVHSQTFKPNKCIQYIYIIHSLLSFIQIQLYVLSLKDNWACLSLYKKIRRYLVWLGDCYSLLYVVINTLCHCDTPDTKGPQSTAINIYDCISQLPYISLPNRADLKSETLGSFGKIW